MKGLLHGAFFLRNTRKGNLSFGLAEGDTNVYDYEFDKERNLTVIRSKKTGQIITLGSVFPTK